jgi:hypothetical protein
MELNLFRLFQGSIGWFVSEPKALPLGWDIPDFQSENNQGMS